jgi:hypothetical protein
MAPEELRLECLKLVLQGANVSGILLETSQLISRACAYADFAINQSGNGDSVNRMPVPTMTLMKDCETFN